MIEILRAELVSDEPLFDTFAVTVLGQSPIGRSQSDGLPLVSTMAGVDADEEFWSEQRAYCDTLMDAQESVGSLLEYTQGKATDDPLNGARTKWDAVAADAGGGCCVIA